MNPGVNPGVNLRVMPGVMPGVFVVNSARVFKNARVLLKCESFYEMRKFYWVNPGLASGINWVGQNLKI